MKQYALVLTLIGFGICPAVAKEYRVSPETDVESIARTIRAGDVVTLQDGIWSDAQLKFERLPGTAEKPILIRSKTPGGVVFTGASEFRLSGTYVTVTGLVFRDTDGVSDVVQFRSHSERHAHHCRITECVFEQTSDGDPGIESRWLSVFGTHNRIDHCYFAGKRSRGPTLVVWVAEQTEQHQIDHNHFGPRPVLGRNGGETIRIGTSDVSELNCGTVVNDNYFHRCNGEAEIISNKSCQNVYRHNVFDECSGALTLRHGHQCVVDGNVFFGRKQRGTGGVRIIGRDHNVTNNYFESLRGDAERAAICFMNGIPNGSLNSYAPVVRANVAHNTFVDCKVSLEFGVGAGRKQSARPTDCRIAHNLFLPDKWSLFRIHAAPVNCVWEGNKHQSGRTDEGQFVRFERCEMKLTRASDGMLRPAELGHLESTVASMISHDIDGHKRGAIFVSGCDDPTTATRKPVSARDTGPEWRTRH